MRRLCKLLCALGLGLAASCTGAEQGDSSIELLPRILSDKNPHMDRLGETELLGIYQLRSKNPGFGGISGIHFDGKVLTGITDLGNWLHFVLETDKNGRPILAKALVVAPLGGLDGSKSDSDAEDLAKVPGGWLVSFERHHRVSSYSSDFSVVFENLSVPGEFGEQPWNGGVEAVTALQDGRILMLSEEGGMNPDETTGWGWIGGPGQWSRFTYGREAKFRPTAVAQLPGGDLLVAERRFTLIGGVALRLVRVKLSDLREGGLVQGQELFRLAPPSLVDNFEGLALHQRADGRVVAYLISDDNFNPLQATFLLAVVLPP